MLSSLLTSRTFIEGVTDGEMLRNVEGIIKFWFGKIKGSTLIGSVNEPLNFIEGTMEGILVKMAEGASVGIFDVISVGMVDDKPVGASDRDELGDVVE